MARDRNGKGTDGLPAGQCGELLQGLSTGIVILDSGWHYVFANEMALELIGWSKEELVGKVIWEAFPLVIGSNLETCFRRVMEERSPASFEVHIPYRGTWNDLYVFPVDSGIAVQFTDITERKRLEAEQGRLSLQRQLALDAARMGWWHYDPVTKVATCDERYREIFGIAGDRHPTEKLLKRVHPDDLPQVLASMEASLDPKGPKPFSAEYRIFLDNGAVRWIEAHGIATFEGEGAGRRATSLVGTVADITERKNALSELESSRHWLERITSTTPDIIFVTDINDFHNIYSNRSVFSSLGYTEEEIRRSGNVLAAVTHPDDRASAERFYREMRGAEPGEVRVQKHRVCHKDGSVRWLEITASPFSWDEGGRVRELIGISRDITGQVATETELRESRAKLEAVIQSMSDSVYITDASGHFLDFNDAFVRVHRFASREDALRKLEEYGKYFEVCSPDGKEVPPEQWALARALRGETTETVEYLLRRKDTGERWWASYSYGPVRDRDGRIIGAVTVGRDISAAKKAEEDLRRREEELRRITENSPDVIARYDRRLRHVFINLYGEKVFGKPRSEIIGRTNAELGMPADKVSVWHRLMEEAFASGKQGTIEFEFNSRPFGRQHFFSVVVPEHDEGGGVETLLVITRDVTELKRAEEELRVRNAQFEAFFASSPGILNLLDENFRYINTDRVTPGYFGLTRETIRGKRAGDLSPLFLHDFGGRLRRVLATGAPELNVEVQNRVPGREGGIAYWRASYFRVPLAGGKWGLGVVGVEITDMKKVEVTMRRNEYELRTLVNNSPDLIFRFNRRLQYRYVNPAYERITGIPRERFAGRTNAELGMKPQMVKFWETEVRKVVDEGKERSAEFEMQGLFGRRFFFARLIPEYAPSGVIESVLVLARDTTERRCAEEELRYISFHDAVTGLFNRAFWEERLRRADAEREYPVSVIMGEAGNLRLVNEVFGRDEGDRLLRTVARALEKACGRNAVAARWDGSEFAVLLPGTDERTAGGICAKVREFIGDGGRTAIGPGISLGAAERERPEESLSQVVRRAGDRMYDNGIAGSRRNEDAVLSSLAGRVRGRSAEIGAHVERCRTLARRFGNALGLSDEQMADLRLLVELHDIGDAVIPREVLEKRGRLSPDEWAAVKRRAEAGSRIARNFPDTARVSDEVYAHGERWDGAGYPRRLRGRGIPYLARVLAVLDAYDVMTHPRPYAPVMTHEEAVAELRRNAGLQFDPELVERFIGALAESGLPAGS